MARTHAAVAEMKGIVEIHRQLRSVFRVPSSVAHFVNENTVVRTAAVIERHLERRVRRRIPVGKKKSLSMEDLLGNWDADAHWPDICMRTLFLLRHFIVHLSGEYRPRSLRPWSRQNLLPAYRRFRGCIPAAKVKENQVLCLDATEVMTPLLIGCRDYWQSRR